MGSLKTFIKSVRKAKTIADERAVVRKESAAIRTSFRDPNLDQTNRRIQISKLLYLYIMGEKTHFGQVECLKLLALPRFADKRLGYLATMLLLDENQEVLTLLTNSLDNDMQHPNAYINGLALCCLGNIASPELARDLYADVDKLIASNNPFLKKKACLVAAKLIEKDPDLAEIFLPRLPALIEDKHHNLLLGTLRLIQASYVDPTARPTLLKFIPNLVSHLKRITTSGYMPDYDVFSISDPFAQVSLLETLRLLATDPECPTPYLEEVNDILTQVASNIDGGKNAAHAVLYECVKTIFAIKSDQSLKILGVNLLGKFLSTKDNNIRYVALDSLLTVMSIEPQAVQRHRATIVGCLVDGDISIRRRALELTFAILNEQNIRVLAREVLVFLENCTDNDLRPYITTQLTIAASKYAPNEKWHFDTLMRMLKLLGNYVTPDIISNILALIMQCTNIELKKHIVGKLLSLSLEDNSQFGLVLVTLWCIGEYGELLLDGKIEVKNASINVTEPLILKFIEDSSTNSSFSDLELVQIVTLVLTTVLKLSVKFTDPNTIESLRLFLQSKTYDTNLEIQTRAVEYQKIFEEDMHLKKGLLSAMPAPPIKERESLSLHPSVATSKQAMSKSSSAFGSGSLKQDSSSLGNDLLLDLMNEVSSTPNQGALLSGNGNSTHVSSGNNTDILSLFDSPAAVASPASAAPQKSAQEIAAFSNNLISVSFAPVSITPGHAHLQAFIRAATQGVTVSQFQLLIAVPKSQKLLIISTSGGDNITSGNPQISQELDITGKEGSKIKLRVKAKYESQGQSHEETFDFAGLQQTI